MVQRRVARGERGPERPQRVLRYTAMLSQASIQHKHAGQGIALALGDVAVERGQRGRTVYKIYQSAIKLMG